ncbi:GNAT family N-acetyltransferase [Metabacillus endolithicus]|uniref:GNAT family N-acetyltransferase n=1 Tax=Metabacillus endolithicus TaxID=1535204 RepID=A0ABW5BRJ3_9BACI|nr:GNAT family protein [Metabacillus endolithicus]UPG63847.1 GNAT family N-acetyltransferase [Metabacillus endolithicus]
MNIILEELEGKHVKLVPMCKGHVQGLYEIGSDRNIWTYLPSVVSTFDDMKVFIESALNNKENGSEYPFVIIEKETSKIIGTTRFLNISTSNKTVEIGWTWLTPSVWGTSVNKECKFLLLRYCFESLGTIRVQFKTDEQNIRSQRAIEGIGATKEGTLRNHMIRRDGTYRNSVFYSIIESEWGLLKKKFF